MVELMLSILATINQMVETVSGGNDMVKSAIMGALTLGMGACTGFLFYRMPSALAYFFRSQCVTEMRISDIGAGKTLFAILDRHVYRNRIEWLSRTVDVSASWSSEDGVYDLGVGLGTHYFWHGRMLVRVRKTRILQAGLHPLTDLEVTTLGRSHKRINKIFNDLKPEDDDVPSCFSLGKDGWCLDSKLRGGGLDTLALDDDIKAMFRKEMEFYLNGKDEFERLRLPWKISFMLHGVPGSGKTSIIRSIAIEYGLNLHTINLSITAEDAIVSGISTMGKKSLLVLEDIDGCSATMNRELNGGKASEGDSVFGIDLKGLLSVLDGVCQLHGVAIFMTTNYLERIDEALLRDGRTDFVIELPKISAATVDKYFTDIFGELGFKCAEPLDAKSVTKIKLKAKRDGQKALELVNNFHK